MKITLATLPLLVLAFGGTARGQSQHWSPYSQSVYREGPGFKLGNAALVIHPGFAVEGGYDSNVFYAPRQEVGSGILRLRAHIDLATLPPQRMEDDTGTADPKAQFRLSGQVDYREYLSSEPALQAQRSVNVMGNADLYILPRGKFQLHLFDTYVHTVDPRTQEGVQVAARGTPVNFTRNFNRVGFEASYGPGSGRIRFGIGDYFQVNFWETRELKFGDQMQNEAQAFFRIAFLPETIGMLTMRVGYIHFTNNPQLEAIPLRAIASAQSRITRWLSLNGAIGYGYSLHRVGPSFNSVIAHLDAKFNLPRGSNITVGYDRDYYDTLFGNFFTDDRLYASFDQPMVAGRLTAHLEGGVRFRHYEGLIDPMRVGFTQYSSPVRDDLIYEARAELNVVAVSWLQLSASYQLLGDKTSFEFIDAAGNRSPVSFIKHSVFARVDFAY